MNTLYTATETLDHDGAVNDLGGITFYCDPAHVSTLEAAWADALRIALDKDEQVVDWTIGGGVLRVHTDDEDRSREALEAAVETATEWTQDLFDIHPGWHNGN